MKKTDHIILGQFLRKKREALGIKQAEVAKVLGYTSSQFISNCERGLCSPPYNALKKLMKIYKLSKEEVVDIVVTSTKIHLESYLGGSSGRTKRKQG